MVVDLPGLAIDASKGLAPSITRAVSKIGRRRLDRLIANYTNIFDEHLSTVESKVSKIKNLVYRDESVTLESQYVKTNFAQMSRSIRDDAVLTSVKNGGRYIVSGTAGAGKTVFAKWLALSLINTRATHQLIPIFFELRDLLEEDTDSELEDVIFNKVSSSRSKSNRQQFRIGLESGIFVLIFDAVDEVRPSYRDSAIRKITNLLKNYPSCAVVMTTRPDYNVESLEGLGVLRTVPMSMKQICDVIQKIDYAEGVKRKLLDELREYLYEEHKSFLSNPLLATIMLLTYDHASSIPTRMTTFYRQAFETLYQRHDSSKTDIFRRDHHAGLQMDEFAQLFSVVCYKTLIEARFELTSIELLEQFRAAISYLGWSVRAELAMRDAIESVCLIQRDGLSYVFAHRSFQEYFASVFVKEYRGEDVKDVFDRACDHAHGENVLKMIHEIAPELVDTVYLKPTFDEWLDTHANSRLNDPRYLHLLGSSLMESFQYSCSTKEIINIYVDESSFGGFLSRVSYVFPELSFPHDIINDEYLLISDISALSRDDNLLTPTLKDLSGLLGAKVTVKVPMTRREVNWLALTRLVNRFELVREEVIWFSNVVNERIKNGNRKIKELIRGGTWRS